MNVVQAFNKDLCEWGHTIYVCCTQQWPALIYRHRLADVQPVLRVW